MSHSPTCKRVYQFVCENLDQDTDSPECRAIRKHLGQCSECTTYLRSLKKTVQLYKMLPSPRVPKAVHRDLFKHLACLSPADTPRTTPRRPRAGGKG